MFFIARHPGCPNAATWDWGDGSPPEQGDEIGHEYLSTGPFTVTLTLPDADQWLAAFTTYECLIVGDVLAALQGCRALTKVEVRMVPLVTSAPTLATLAGWWPNLEYLCVDFVVTGTLADLPATMTNLTLDGGDAAVTGALSDLPDGMQRLVLMGTKSSITGELADLPATMQLLSLTNTPSAVTGTLADLPTALTYLSLSNTNSTITGAGSPTSPALKDVFIADLGLSQPVVDAILYDLYLGSAAPHVANGVLQIGGSNATPSGTFQAAASCPVTVATPGKELAYELLNDSCNAFANHWATVTISA